MIIYAYLLLASIAISTVNAECVDIEPFTFKDNDNTMCAGSDCGKNKVKTNCPLTCGECTPVATDCADTEPFTFQGNDNTMCAGSDCGKNKVLTNCPLTCGECTPDSSGTGGGNSGADCADTEPFKFQGNDNAMCAGSDCGKNKVLTNCPLTCGECTPDSSGTGGGDSGADCADTEPFKFQGDDNAMCAGADCSKNKVLTNCPLTCGECTPDSSGTGGGDSGGYDSCEDAPKSFKVNGENGKKKCKKWASLCGKDSKIDDKCPKTCGLCGPPTDPPTTPCVDVNGKFKLGNSGKKNCKQIRKKKKKHCGKIEAIENCPMTCGLCMTKSPTSSPSAAPSVFPTSSPSAAPSPVPTPTPSDAPSASPSKTVCNLKGTIRIPGMGNATNGYHSASLRVSKGNWDVVCSSKKRKTGWGCIHEGAAKIGVWTDDTVGCKEDETATIEYAAGGTYSFTMQHIFDDLELYYADDHLVRPELTVTANDITIDETFPYRYPKNKNTDTHDAEGFANGAYEGMVSANVECDADCSCNSVRVMPECPIRAEIRFPTVQTAASEGIEGYHNDAISVSQDGVEEICSSSDPIRKWCVHEGDGLFYASYTDDGYNENDTESIVIPEAKGGKYLFEITHDMTAAEEYYYGGNDGLSGEVHVWIGNKKRPVFTHILNNKYEDTFYLDAECDDECTCRIDQRKSPVCKIDAKVKFPNKENMEYYGYKNDYIIAEKSGEIERCQWETMGATAWNCLHDGGDAFVWYGEDGSYEKDSESVTINNAAGGNFRLTLQHWLSDLELYYDNDHAIVGTMSVSINDVEPEKFSYPQPFEIDTHLEDESGNPDYPGTLYVDVMCDSRCNCDMIERLPTCELKAELSFPDFGDDYYGYSAELVSVVKDGYDDECGYYSPMTNWGCFSSGDAFIIEYNEESTDYYDTKSSQLINIPDASGGEFYFTVEFYNAEQDPYYDDVHKFKSFLNVTVNDEAKGTFNHKLNTEEPMYNDDGTLYEDYTSEIYVTVTCDENCSCEAKRGKSD